MRGNIMTKIMETLKKWWLVLILGIISIGLGIWALANPGAGFSAVSLIVAIDFIVVGVFSVAYVIANRDIIPAWGWDLVAAIIILLLGIAVAAIPGLSESIAIWLFTFGFIFKGIFSIFKAFTFKSEGVKGWGWVLALGIITLILGIMLIVNPIVSALSIDLLAAFGMFSFGISMIVTSIQMSKAKSTIESFKENRR